MIKRLKVIVSPSSAKATAVVLSPDSKIKLSELTSNPACICPGERFGGTGSIVGAVLTSPTFIFHVTSFDVLEGPSVPFV